MQDGSAGGDVRGIVGAMHKLAEAARETFVQQGRRGGIPLDQSWLGIPADGHGVRASGLAFFEKYTAEALLSLRSGDQAEAENQLSVLLQSCQKCFGFECALSEQEVRPAHATAKTLLGMMKVRALTSLHSDQWWADQGRAERKQSCIVTMLEHSSKYAWIHFAFYAERAHSESKVAYNSEWQAHLAAQVSS